jgi:outer membrane protein OmpA-like peptidoglycan-associated protein
MLRTSALLIIFAFSLTVAFGQGKTLKKANEYFKNGEYAEAMPLLEEVLQESDSRLAKTKLAYCYKMNNLLPEAEQLYAELVLDEHSPDITLYYYGEALMSNEKYEEAKIWFNKYLELQPDSENAPLLIKSCESAGKIKPWFDSIKIFEFPNNSIADDNAPVFWKDKIVFTSDRKVGIKLLKKKSGWTGRDFLKLYTVRQTEDGGFSEAEDLNKLNEVNKNTTNAVFDTVANKVYFTKNANTANKQNTYNLQLYQADFDKQGNFKNIEKLSFCNIGSNYMHPAISPDGSLLFYVADRANGEGGTDIYVSTKKSNGEWAPGKNLGPEVNTSAHEGFPFIDKAGNLYFSSKGHIGFGGFDIFISKPNIDGTWSKPINLGKPVNSPLDDISICINQDYTKGMFTSAREGGDDDIYIFYLASSAQKFTDIPDHLISYAPQQEPAPAIKEIRKEQDNKKTDTPRVALEIPEKSIKKEPVTTTAKESYAKKENEPLVSDLPLKSMTTLEKEAAMMPKVKQEDASTLQEENFVTEKEIQEQQNRQSAEMEVTPVKMTTNHFEKKETNKTYAFDESDLVRHAWNKSLAFDQRFVISQLKFNISSTEIQAIHRNELNKLLQFLKQYPELKIELACHSVTLYDAYENLDRSTKRSQNIRSYLISQGIEESRLTAKGYGESQPLNDCRTVEDCPIGEHLENQRLEIRIVETNY